MKIVFSRKGFDSQNGGVPSPIFPDGTALSLPIPYPRSPTRFRDVRWRSTSLGPIVECLSNGRVKGKHWCHLDPDLNADALARSPGWRPAFGQVEIAQRHLENQGVGPGDLFLFFGWFRAVEPGNGGTWRYVRNAGWRALRCSVGSSAAQQALLFRRRSSVIREGASSQQMSREEIRGVFLQG